MLAMLHTLGRFFFSQPKSRLIQLDLLRGIAIILVLRRHYGGPGGAGFLQPLDDLWNRIGWAGVDLFFVLSGFLVGGLLMQEYSKEGVINAKRFIIRRIFKIWPLYYVYLLFVLIRMVQRAHVSPIDALVQLWPNLAHVQNYHSVVAAPNGTDLVFMGAPLVHTWTLSIEEHFYLLLPLLLVWLTRKGDVFLRRVFPIVTLTVMIFCLSMRILHWISQAPNSPNGTHMRMDSLFWGVALAYLFHLRRDIFQSLMRSPVRVALLGVLCLLPFCFLEIVQPLVWTIGFSVLAFGFGCILLVMVHNTEASSSRIERNPITRAIAFIGVYSYPIYLWHMTFGQSLPKWFMRHSWLSGSSELRWIVVMGLYIFCSTLVGVLMGRIIERPALILRDRLFPARTTGVTPPADPPQQQPLFLPVNSMERGQ